MKFKNKLAISLSVALLAMTSFLVTPQALAHSASDRVAQAANKKIDSMAAQLQQMTNMMNTMKAELQRVKAQAMVPATKVQELDDWVSAQKSAPALSKDSQFIVRGGWSHFNDNRGSNKELASGGDISTTPTDKDAFYYGGAFNHNINNDLFGLKENTSFQIEFGIEYAELGDREESKLTKAITIADQQRILKKTGIDLAGKNYQQSVTVNMLRINASPKIKFRHGQKFRPWIIPLGLDINIISPPSDAVTVLNTGMNFGAGADYELYKGISIGADGRYHWSPDDLDGVDTDGFQLGGYLGFAF